MTQRQTREEEDELETTATQVNHDADDHPAPSSAVKKPSKPAKGDVQGQMMAKYENYYPIMQKLAKQYAPRFEKYGMHFRAEILLATAMQESGGTKDPKSAVSFDHGLGMMQITPSKDGKLDAPVAKAIGWDNSKSIAYNDAHSKWKDPTANITAGIETMLVKTQSIAKLASKVWGQMNEQQKWMAVMYGYNAGQGNAAKALNAQGPNAKFISTYKDKQGKVHSHDYTKELKGRLDYVDQHSPFEKEGGESTPGDGPQAASPEKEGEKEGEKKGGWLDRALGIWDGVKKAGSDLVSDPAGTANRAVEQARELGNEGVSEAKEIWQEGKERAGQVVDWVQGKGKTLVDSIWNSGNGAGTENGQQTPESPAAAPQATAGRLAQLMSKPRLTPEEIEEARSLIARQPEEAQGDLYQQLQSKTPYHNQRNNASTEAGRGNIGDVMCNLTSVAMCLETVGIHNPEPTKFPQFEDYLEHLRVKHKLPARTTEGGWGGVARLMGATVTQLGGGVHKKAWWMTTVVPKLRSGQAIILSIDGHIVRLQECTATGIVVDDPFGASKLKAGGGKAGRGWTSVNKKGGVGGDESKGVTGEDHVWPWADVEIHRFLWVASIARK